MSIPWEEEEFERFLGFLKGKRGLDFTGYKRASVARRVARRMQAAEAESLAGYMDRLEVDPEEFVFLLNTILINVTSFFRDTQAWEFLAKEVIPDIIAHRDPGAWLRVWSAGCASGQEAYSLAMVLGEALGEQQLQERVKIYATDVDEEALSQARRATYPAREMEGVPEHLAAKYFRQSGNQYTFRQDLRRAVIFGRHNLLVDAPISGLDLLVCRNTLMYFTAESQRRVISLFHFALQDTGFLFLGKAEMLLTSAPLFTPINARHRVFRKVPTVSRERVYLPPVPNGLAPPQLAPSARLREAATEVQPTASILVDAGSTLVSANAAARSLFGISRDDIGKPLQDLDISSRPVELRSRIEQAARRRRPVREEGVGYEAGGGLRYFTVEVQPLLDGAGALLGTSIVFEDTTYEHDLHLALDRAKAELQAAAEERQSSNEEPETMSEQLQSSNEELHTTNEQLRVSTENLSRANNFLSSVMDSLRVGVVVVDPNMTVLMWNRQAEAMWGLRASEATGSLLMNLGTGLPLDRLRAPLRRVIAGESKAEEMALDATNRRGRPIRCRVAVTPLTAVGREGQGGVLVMEDLSEQAKTGE